MSLALKSLKRSQLGILKGGWMLSSIRVGPVPWCASSAQKDLGICTSNVGRSQVAQRAQLPEPSHNNGESNGKEHGK